jgi:hypothetical protein
VGASANTDNIVATTKATAKYLCRMQSFLIPPFSNGRSRAGLQRKRTSSAAQNAAAHAPKIKRQDLEIVGAGEGIRTLDPDLGKVVLYP